MAHQKSADPNVFILPDVGEGVHEAELIKWCVQVGQHVDENETLVELNTDKALVEIPSPRAGTIAQLHGTAGEILKVGNPLVSYVPEGAAAAPAPHKNNGATKNGADAGCDMGAQIASHVEAAEQEDAGTVVGSLSANPGVEAAPGKVLATPAVRRLARDLGIDISAIKGTGMGGRVVEKDVRGAKSGGSSKASPAAKSAPATSPAAPLAKPASSPSETRRPLPAAPAAAPIQRPSAPAPQYAPQPYPSYPTNAPQAPAYGYPPPPTPYGYAPYPPYPPPSPHYPYYAPAPAMPYPMYPPPPPGYGYPMPYPAAAPGGAPSGGIPHLPGYVPSQGGRPIPDPAQTSQIAPGSTEAHVPFRGVRRNIATRLRESVNTAVHFTVVDDADVTALDELRRQIAAESGEKISFLPFVCAAVCRALTGKFGALNARVDDTAQEIVQHAAVHLGIATDTENGLMVPVIRDASRLGVVDMARSIAQVASAARDRTAPRDMLMGSTFTITNVGSHAGKFATPVINYPEVGILATGRVYDAVLVRDGQAVIGKLMPLSLACDHRVVDGATAALALAEIVRLLQDPTSLV